MGMAQLGGQGGAAELASQLSLLRPTHISLRLPRFKLEFGVHDLKPELQSAFGLGAAFGGTREFDAMSSDGSVHLSSVMHKAIVEVNEEGTRAAAATAGITMTVAIAMPMEITIDRPFIFLIRDVST